MKDNINPNHYKNQPWECFEFTKYMDFALGNAFKYVFRYKHKNGAEDLKKALWYLNSDACSNATIDFETLLLLQRRLWECRFSLIEMSILQNMLWLATKEDTPHTAELVHMQLEHLLDGVENGANHA